MALFQPTNITPSDLSGAGTIDATNDLPVTWQVNGTGNTPMTAYKIDIMLNDTASTLLYSTGQVTLAEPFYGNDALGNPQYFTAAVNAAALSAAGVVNSATNSYKLLITQWWNGDESVEQSSASVFIARDNPTVSITNFESTINTISYTFLGSYSQAQGDPIEWARWQISGSANNDVLVDTGRIYGVGELKTSYDGFLNGNNYIIRLSGETINGIEFDTGWQTFVAQYDITILDGAMKACGRKDTDAVQVSFPTPLYTMGNGGGDYEIEDHLYTSVGPDDLITVNDAIEAPMKSLTVEMEASQDLNGYANPWPAGGGKNKLDATFDSGEHRTVTFTVYKHQGYVEHIVMNGTADGTAARWGGEVHLKAGSYKLSGCTGGAIATYNQAIRSGGTSGSVIGQVNQNGDATVNIDTDGTYYLTLIVSAGVTVDNVEIWPMLRLSTVTDSTYAPYQNVCPITGYTSASGYVDTDYTSVINWNQYISNGDFSNGTTGWTVNTSTQPITLSTENGILTAEVTGSLNSQFSGPQQASAAMNSLTVGHWVLLSADIRQSHGTPYFGITNTQAAYAQGNIPIEDNWYRCGRIVKVLSGAAHSFQIYAGSMYASFQVGDTIQVRNACVFDLTQMLGADTADYIASLETYLASTTGEGVAYFRSIFPKTYYDYTTGTVTLAAAVNGDPYDTATVTFPALGKNLLNMAVGTHNAWSFVNIPNNLKPNTQYTFSIQGTTSYTYTLYLGNSEQSTRALSSAITAGGSSTFTTPDDMSTEPLLAVAGSTSGAGNEDLANIKPQVELGASKTSYEAYTSTVYGGTYDFVRGKLRLTKTAQTYTSFTGVFGATNLGYYAAYISMPIGKTSDVLSNEFRYSGLSYDNMDLYTFVGGSGSQTTWTFILPGTITNKAEADAWAAANPIQVLRPLETPIEFDLTPDELSTFLGTNNIWSDAGEVTAEYAIGQNAVLKLPTNADSAIWDSAGAAPFSIVAPFAVAWRAIMTDVTATLPLISVTMVNGILNVTASSDGVTASVSGQQLFNSPTVLANDDDVLLYIQQNQWSLVVNGAVADSGTIPNAWEDEISSIMLYGPQTCLFVWIVENAFTMAQMAKAQENDPAYDNTTHFLAQFNDGLSAGAIRAQEDVTKVTLYRRQAGKMTVQKMVSTDPNSTAVRDYAALNGHSYTYTLIGETAEGNSTSAISSNIASPCIWNYTLMLCTKDANGFYHVQQEYRFSLDVASGTTNNNNNPTLQTNFTRYPLRQPNAQNYRSGTLTSFVGKAVNGKYVDSLSEIDALREISTSSMYKFLKTRKGEIMMVDTASPITLTITDKFEQQPVRAAIPWAEIGDANGKSVITVSGDTYWPND